jgi:hypothetical protein
MIEGEKNLFFFPGSNYLKINKSKNFDILFFDHMYYRAVMSR